MLRVLSVVACALMLAGCQTHGGLTYLAAGQFEEPVPAGHTFVRLYGVDRDRWIGGNADTFAVARTVYQCKALACPSPSDVLYTRAKSPTRKPDPTAIARYAAEEDSKFAADGWSLTTTRISTAKGYPAIFRDANKVIDGKTLYRSQVLLFSGGIMVSIVARSQDVGVTHRYRDEFLGYLQIKDGGPRPSR